MRAAFLCCLVVACPVLAQDKKPEKITAENIEVGKVGTIDRLTVEKAFQDVDTIIARFDGIRVCIRGYPTKGIGKGKVLPKDQVWKVTDVIDRDTSGEGLSGCYLMRPEKKEKK